MRAIELARHPTGRSSNSMLKNGRAYVSLRLNEMPLGGEDGTLNAENRLSPATIFTTFRPAL
jgi:hypothetical protein